VSSPRPATTKVEAPGTLGLIGRLMAYRPGLYAVNALLWMFVHAAFILPGLLVKAFFDALEGRPTAPGTTGTVLLLIAAFTLARIAHIYVSALVDILHRFTMSSLVRANSFLAILRLPGALPLAASPTEALDYIKEDAAQIEDSISWTLDVLGSAVFTIVALAVLVGIDALVTLIAFAPLVLVVAVAKRAEDRVGRYREAARSASEAATGAIGEAFGAVQAIKAAGAEEAALRHLSGLCETRKRRALADALFNQLLESIYHNTVGIGTGILLIAVSARIASRGFSLGDFSLFVFCLSFVSDYTTFWGGFLAHFQQTRVALERLMGLVRDASGLALVEATPLHIGGRGRAGHDVGAPDSRSSSRRGLEVEPGPEPGPEPAALQVEGLSCLHDSGRGIHDLSFEVGAGEFVVVTGRIGSGKTTLLRALQGLLPSKGAILLDGRAVADAAATFVPPTSAYTPQVPRLFSDSIAENIVLGLAAGDEALAEALREAVLEEDLAGMPEGLATRIGPRGLKLSGGQLQRTAAARMFLRRPRIYFIDDMSSALDVATEERLWRRFAESGPRTCLAVSHRRATLALADQVLVLAEGRIAARGRPGELLDSSEEFRRLWGS